MATVYVNGEYHWQRENHYTPRNVFIDEWAASQAE